MKQAAALHDVDTNYVSAGSNITNNGQVKVEHLDGQKGEKKAEKKSWIKYSCPTAKAA